MLYNTHFGGIAKRGLESNGEEGGNRIRGRPGKSWGSLLWFLVLRHKLASELRHPQEGDGSVWRELSFLRIR